MCVYMLANQLAQCAWCAAWHMTIRIRCDTTLPYGAAQYRITSWPASLGLLMYTIITDDGEYRQFSGLA